MSKFYILLFVLICNIAEGQKISIRGVVTDSTGSFLPSATVMLLKQADSSLVNFTVTNTQGMFELKHVERLPYFLKVTFVGYKTYTTEIQTPAPSVAFIDLGTVKMSVAKTTLDEVVIEDRIPVIVKQDTIE